MKQFLINLGMSDESGESISHTRLINVLIALSWLASKFYNAHLTHQPITWDTSDLEVLGVIGGISIGKSVAENSKPDVTISSTTTNAPKV